MEDEQFPPNSHARRSNENKKDPEKDAIQKVVTGKVIKRKKPLGKRFRDLFVGGDAQSVGSYIVMDVLIPALKDTIRDVIWEGTERMLFGDRGGSRRPPSSRGAGHATYTPYNRYSSQAPWRRENREEPRTVSRRARASHDFDEIILGSRHEGEAVIDNLFNLISKYGQATVADLYELVGVSGNFTDERWGWFDLRGAAVSRTRDGYLLDLPRPEPLPD